MSFERQQGQRYAAEVLLSVATTPKAFYDELGPIATIAANLARTAEHRPAEYAQGIRDVLYRVSEAAA